MRVGLFVSAIFVCVVWKPETNLRDYAEMVVGVLIFLGCCDVAEIFRRRHKP